MINEKSGLTEEEKEIADHLVSAWNKFLILQSNYGEHLYLDEFAMGLHMCQSALASRVLHRLFPDHWR